MSLLSVLNIIGSLALFIFGMKTISDAIQRVSGAGIRQSINRTTKNRYSAMFAGLGLTAAIQSSSAFSVLILSFVNAKVINLKRSFALMIGANIGTTTTLWLLYWGLTWKIELLMLPLIAIALPFFLGRNSKRKNWAQVVIGLTLVFIGIYFLGINVPSEELIFDFLKPNVKLSYTYCLLFLLIGLVITLLFQSSSATTGLILVAFQQTQMPLELGIMMIIGANIGTTITAHIAAAIGSFAVKTVAIFHTTFNVVGAILFYFLVSSFSTVLIEHFDSTANGLNLAIFHTIFNIGTAIFFLITFKFWVGLFVRMSKKYTKKETNNDKVQFNNPQLYLHEANKEILKFVSVTKQTINVLGRLITESNEEKFAELKDRTFELEKQGDELERGVLVHLRKIYNFEMSGEISKQVHNLMDACYHLENVGDLAIKTADIHWKRRESNSYITPKLRSLLLEMHETLSSATTILIQNLNENANEIDLEPAKKAERELNRHYEQSNSSLMRALEKEKIPMLSILYYQELIQNYEIIGDHIYKANASLAGEMD